MSYSRIAGTGSFLPEKVLSNDDLAKLVDTHRPARLIIDLSQVSYMDSSGVATLVEILQSHSRQVRGNGHARRLEHFKILGRNHTATHHDNIVSVLFPPEKEESTGKRGSS